MSSASSDGSAPSTRSQSPPSRSRNLMAFCQSHGIAIGELRIAMLRGSLQDEPVDELSAQMVLPFVLKFCAGLKPKLNHPDFPTGIKRRVFREDSSKPGSYTTAPTIDLVAFRELCTRTARQFQVGSDGDFDFYGVMDALLRSAFKPPSPVSPILNTPEVQDGYDRFARVFSSEYIGNAHLRLNGRILHDYRRRYERGSVYGRTVPIIQSSGTGKTRMVYELSAVWPTLILHLRRRPDDPDAGFPTADEPVVTFFRDHAASFGGPNLAMVAFLTAWFTVAAENVRSRAGSISSMAEIFRPWWYPLAAVDIQHSSRSALFEEVSERALAFGKTCPTMMKQAQQLLNEADEAAKLILSMLVPAMEELTDALVALGPVQRSLKALSSGHRGIAYVAIDEFGLLDEFPLAGMVPALRRCFAEISNRQSKGKSHRLEFWFLLLDTNSAIDRARPPQELERSQRAATETRLPAWTDVPLDVLVLEARPLRCPNDALSLGYLKLFGRPLWNASKDRSVVDAAITKLAMKPLGSANANLDSADVVVSLLSQRCCLELLPLRSNTSAAKMAVTAVQSHMRFLVDINSNGICNTAVPSEPLLAIAAWKVMTQGPGFYSKVLNTFYRDLLPLGNELGLRGSIGEFLARLLLTMGRDAAYGAAKASSDAAFESLTAISLTSFLNGMVGPEMFAPISSHAVIKDLPTAWMSFTHIVALDDPLTATRPPFLWNLWKRGAALQCCHSQLGVDGLIPVFVGDNTDLTFADHRRGSRDGEEEMSSEQAGGDDGMEAYMEERMSFIAWQVKYRERPTYKLEHLHGPSIHPDNVDKHWQASSLLTLVFKIGTESRFSNNELFSLSKEPCSAPFCHVPGPTPVLRLRGATAQTFGCISTLGVAQDFAKLTTARQAPATETRPLMPIKQTWPRPEDTSHKPPFAIVDQAAIDAAAPAPMDED